MTISEHILGAVRLDPAAATSPNLLLRAVWRDVEPEADLAEVLPSLPSASTIVREFAILRRRGLVSQYTGGSVR